ncbi:MAG: TIR domain-containing protein, partial [Oscillibacter sp.]|nr:TIR domain-containing protein [Oscillibacter sp.]
GCPVILALNKADLNATVSVNERDLRERNPALKTVLKTSAAVKSGWRFGVNTLMQAVRDEIPGAVSGYKMNADMLAVKQDLENMREDYISSEQYRKLCADHHITDENLQYGLLGFFRDLGVAYFYESDAFDTRLESVRVLNPEWLTNGIYRLILRTREDGFLPHKEIKDTLRRSFARDVKERITYTPEETEFILHVMRFFQISHDMGNGVEMIPMKMPKTPPDTVDAFHKENALHLRWEGDYLPNNLIHRLMIRKFPELDQSCVWRTGGRFRQKSGGCEALAEMNDKALSVYALGKDARVYMDSFREEILRILDELNIKPKEYVFCKSEDGREGKVLYQTLKRLYDMNVQAHFVDDLQDFINPKSVMEGSYVTLEERRTLKNSVEYCTEVRDFFISYNKANAERAWWIADTLKRNGYSVYIQAADCAPSTRFTQWMDEAITQSRGFLAVWSGDYERSDYCKDELNAAYVREKNLKKAGGIYPILPLRVENMAVENSLFAGVVRVDLLSRNEAENRSALLDAVGKLRLAPQP